MIITETVELPQLIYTEGPFLTNADGEVFSWDFDEHYMTRDKFGVVRYFLTPRCVDGCLARMVVCYTNSEHITLGDVERLGDAISLVVQGYEPVREQDVPLPIDDGGSDDESESDDGEGDGEDVPYEDDDEDEWGDESDNGDCEYW